MTVALQLFEYFVILVVTPAVLLCLVLSVNLLKYLFIHPNDNTQRIDTKLKVAAMCTVVFFSLCNLWVIIQAYILVCTPNHKLQQDNRSASLKTALSFMNNGIFYCREQGILSLFAYFLLRLYIAFEYSKTLLIGLYAILILHLVGIPIVDSLYHEHHTDVGIYIYMYTLYVCICAFHT